MKNPQDHPAIDAREAVGRALRNAQERAVGQYGIAWRHLEEVSRFELFADEFAALSRPASEEREGCDNCGGSGEIFGHADDCRHDDCALALGIDDCAGQVSPCPSCALLPSSEPAAREGAPHYLSDRFAYAAPGDQQEDAWLLRFCDTERREAIWTGPDAEAEAWKAWEQYAPTYNCYVFRLARLSTPPSAPDSETGWRDIESAPKDGTQFLALVSNGWYALVSAPVQGLREGWPFQWWRSSDRRSYPVVETHLADYDWSQSYALLLTHWHPLPAAPTTEERK